MEDTQIIDLYLQRDETAIRRTAEKYGARLRSFAFGIVKDRQTAEECENDTYLRTWNAIPPARPRFLRAFLGKITRHLALDRYAAKTADKRRASLCEISEELSTCLPDASQGDSGEQLALTDSLNRFLSGLPSLTRVVFVRRYFYLLSIREIARDLGLGESYVKVMLHRTRNTLRHFLEKDGFDL